MKRIEELNEFLADDLAVAALTPDKIIKTGYSFIDDYAPLVEGQNTIITARTGKGKTVWGVNLINGILTHSEALIVVFSVELRKVEFFQRLLASYFDAPLDNFKKGLFGADGKLDERQKKVYSDSINDYLSKFKSRLLICDYLHEIKDIETKLESLKSQYNYPTTYVLIDYANILSVQNQKDTNKHIDISNWAKFLAKEQGYHVQLLCQANRQTSEREDGFARTENLADSDQYGRDAFVIYSVQGKEDKFLISPTKNRNGQPELIFEFEWNPESGKVSFTGKITGEKKPKNKQKKVKDSGQFTL